MNRAYTWDDYIYAVNDVLLWKGEPTITNKDGDILELCYNHCYSENQAATAVLTDRENRK